MSRPHGALSPTIIGNWMQLGGAGSCEEPIPRCGSNAGDAGEPPVRDAEADRALEPGAVGEEIAGRGLAAGIDGHHEEDRRAGQGLSTGWAVGPMAGSVDPVRLHLLEFEAGCRAKCRDGRLTLCRAISLISRIIDKLREASR